MAQDDEYPAGVSDARLAACQQDVLKMVELAAQVAEGLAANVDPEAEGAPEANTIKEDAAMFLRLADGVQETMAQSRWPVEHAYARSAENLLLRRRLDEMVEEGVMVYDSFFLISVEMHERARDRLPSAVP